MNHSTCYLCPRQTLRVDPGTNTEKVSRFLSLVFLRAANSQGAFLSRRGGGHCKETHSSLNKIREHVFGAVA